MIRADFTIEVSNIRVSRPAGERGSYSFDYQVTHRRRCDAGHVRQSTRHSKYDGTFTAHSREAFRGILKRGHAVQLVIESL